MTQAYNLSQLANNLNSSGQLDATDGLVNAVPVANGGTGASTVSAARTNLDVPSRSGGNATGTWDIGISGNAATATNATNAVNATNATNATNAVNATTAASCSGNSSTATKLTTASGFAPSYSARAWVAFNGENGSILQSANISSISRLEFGRYVANFTTEMQDSNYAVAGSVYNSTGLANLSFSIGTSTSSAPSTTSCSIVIGLGNTTYDASFVSAIWMR